MREIKFRAWDKKSKKMRQVTEIVFNTGFYLEPNDNTVKLIWVKGQDIINDKDIQLQRDDGFILMQYTGLKDKNGKEIYEGDIVLYEDWEICWEGGGNDSFINKGIIEYIDENCCFNVTERQTAELADVLYKENDTLEVIGNIYENPELLEEG